ncbi:MAG: hypothetical protein MUE94_09375 [Verrucomicrobia bacterium]|nr:hypothetical protein [Verrucomicrobiota bacterium]
MNMEGRLVVLVGMLSGALSLNAVNYSGTNQPGARQDYPFTVPVGSSNAAFAVTGSGTAFSHLRLRAGAAPTDIECDFLAAQSGTSNAIHLEWPDLRITNYVLQVSTPSNSAAHAFTVTLTNNVSGIRSASRPASKAIVSASTNTIAASSWQYFRVDIPTNVTGWRITLTSSNVGPNLYVQRDTLPTTTSSLRASTGTSNDLVALTSAEVTPGAYFIGVNQGTGASDYVLRTELIDFLPLAWDPGATHLGTAGYRPPDTNGGDYYFRITTQNTSLGAWRNALTMETGEADLYLAKGAPPSPASHLYKSERIGSDGFIVPASAFNAGEDWYLLVRAAPGSRWSLVSGEPFVTDLGVVATDGSSGSGHLEIGAEGSRFFRTTAAADQVAWRLWLNGAPNTLYVRKNAVPLPGASDLSQAGQLLVVPTYLVGGQLYFVGVAGAPGDLINLDSRAHGFTTLDYTGSTPVTASGFPYTTFRVQVPPDQLAWQVSAIASNGNPNLALRRNFIPNESNNDAYSEVPGSVTDSLTLVPDTLSDGTFYITVYSTNAHACTLVSGPPVIPDVDYTTTVFNTDSNRVGWSIFKVTDINAQVGSLGWDLEVSNAAPGTRIALRQNRAPGIWNYRNPTAGSAGFYTLLSTTNFLQAPDNPAEVWYVGVYNPSNALGAFTLVLRELTASPVSFDGGSLARAEVPAGKWQFFRVDVPPNIVGWDARLTDITSGSPQLVIRRERLPNSLSGIGFSGTVTATNWLTGNQWAAGSDWTGRNNSPDGVPESGRIFTAGLGRPLEAGTYYLGVLSASGSSAPMSYTLRSRGIGTGLTIPVLDLDYLGGSVTNPALAARDLAVYRVNVPSNSPTWKVKLAVSSGDALLAIARGSMPNLTATATGSATNVTTAGRKMSKALETGNEHFFLLPGGANTNVTPGSYYAVVVSEGQVTTDTTRIGTGSSAFILTSLGAAPIIDLGLLDANDLYYNGALEGGDADLLRFDNLPETLGYELSLPVSTGDPWVTSPVSEGSFPNPGSKTPSDTYGNEGGLDGVASPDLITVSGALPGEVLAVKARGSGNQYPDATYTLRIRKLTADPLAFDGGMATVTGQSNIYQFFEVIVPENALGWDIRLTNVTAGDPLLIVCRDYLALDITTSGWQPGEDDFWPSGANWIAGEDWTQRPLSASGVNEDGRILAMGLGQPLEPGTYYVAVKGGSSFAPISYTIVSRGIGDGFSVPVVDLPFAGGTITNTALPPREAAYYRLVIPPEAASWQGRLLVTDGEAMLLVVSNALPNVLTGTSSGRGKSMQKPGHEQYVNLARNTQLFLPSGTHYLAVVSEGQAGTNLTRIGPGTSSFILESRGPVWPLDLGAASSTGLRHTNALEAGEVFAYQFSVPPDTTSVEVELLNRTGNPAMVLRAGAPLPNPGASSPASGPGSVSTDNYGNEGGWTITSSTGNANTSLITVANPSNGVYTVMVKARPLGSLHTNATYELTVRAVSVVPLAFDGGSGSATNQNAGSWRFFQFTVPPEALGWDVRLAQVTGGVAKLVVRRDALPISLSSFAWSSPGNTTNWPGTNQWAAGKDWTERTSSADGVNEDNRILAMGSGQPLEPGTYFAGVFNSTTSNSLSYTLTSRGIGPGFTLPVRDLAFAGGTATNAALPPREADYYRVQVPEGVRGWKVRLTSLSGEALLLSLKDHVPNVATGRSTSALAGKAMQKAGNEHFVLLPPAGQTNLPAGTYHLAVVGEGLNPSAATRVGTGVTSYELKSEGEVNVLDLGTVGGPDLVRTNTLQGGESAFFSFVVPTNTLAIELRLEERVGNPQLVLATNVTLPDPGGVLSGTRDAYGNDGGVTPQFLASNIVTVANPTPGVYQLALKARPGSTGVYPDAACTLRVRHRLAPDLNFTAELNTNGLSHAAAGTLIDRQRAYYRVNVPPQVNNQPVIGWELNVSQSSGTAAIRVRKDALPSDTATSTMPFAPASAVVVPPFLTPGTWFVEVIGTNSTAYTLASSQLAVQRPGWIMPGQGDPVLTPGLSAPEFGDTGVDTNGAALPGDQGTDLEAGRYHYYAVDVPTNNVGLMAVQLVAISGNPDFCLRTNLPPTFSHRTNGVAGSIYDRSLTGSGTDYANWVPLNGLTESRLTPGPWYLAVRAGAAANARYRLRLSTGLVQDLDLATGSALDQSVASNNWRYYRFQVPLTPPDNWHLSFSQLSGDVIMHLRDVIPPGNGTNNASNAIKDWTTDQKNAGPYASYDNPGTYTFSVPPLRPGNVYYVGMRGKRDSTFSLTSSVSGATQPLPPEIAFYGGFVTNTIPAGGLIAYRILTPADALRWRHTSTHSNVVQVYLENGSLPTRSTADDWRSAGVANSSLSSQFLTAYPWLPLQTYYLVATNTSALPQPFSLTLNGSSLTADDDADGMLDVWEVRYFGSLSQGPTADSDNDGVNNLNEFLEGTNPTDRTSLRPRLTVNATNGAVAVDPLASNYTSGVSVTLSATPNTGYDFTGWTGAWSTQTNPLTLVLVSNVTVTAKFRVPGDDFEQRILLSGLGAAAAPLFSAGATKESGEPNHAGNAGGRSLWWTWTAPATDTVRVSTVGSSFRTLLAAYTGAAVNALTLVSNSAAPSGSNGTSLTFSAVTGVTYHFAVDGFGGATGTVALALATATPFMLTQPARLTNDQFRFTILSAPDLVLRVEAGSVPGGWTTLAVITNTTGSYEFVDAASSGLPIRVYRGVVGAGAVGSTNPPVLAAATRLPDGTFQFTILGVISRSVQIEAGTSPHSLVPVSTLTNISSPVIFTDTNAAGTAVRFYRARLQ